MTSLSAISLSPVAIATPVGRAAGAGVAAAATELSDEQQAKVQELKQRDAEVRRHEQAHVRAGGTLAGVPSYEYVRGPDGRQYAVNGEVSIDTGEAGTPEATIRKMELVIRAALAPGDPSAQDRAVAAEARQAKVQAEAELHAEQREAQQSGDPSTDAGAAANPTTAGQATALYRQIAAITEDPFGLNAVRPSASVVA